MDKSFKPVKSVFNSNHEAIKGIMELYGIDQFDLDCTYSQGTFWKGIKGPKIKSDITPLHDDVLEANSENLPFENNSMGSIMYDPPFLIAGKTYKDNKEGSSVIAKRFVCYTTFNDLKKNYYNSLKELYRICKDDGYVVFKCQDTVSGGRNHFSHVMIMNMAMELGFYPKDLFILIAKMRINSFGGRWNKQIHARKHHCYFWVFQKTKPKVNYEKIIQEDFVVNQDTFLPDHQASNFVKSSQEIQ